MKSHGYRSLTSSTPFVAAAILLMAAALIVTKIGRDALFFQGRGLYDLPAAYIGIALLSLPVALVALAVMRLLGPRRARVLLPLAAAPALAAAGGVARPGGGPAMTLFFMLVPLVFGVTLSLCWLLAAELLDGAPRRELARSYSILGAASIAGGLAGGGLGTSLAPRIDPPAFLFIGAALLLGSAAVIWTTQRLFPPRALAEGAPVSLRPRAFWGLLRGRYSLLLLAVAMAASLAGVLIEFHFYLVAATSGNGGRESAGFFGAAYLLLNLIALVPQLLLVPRLQRLIGVHGSLLVLPGVLLGGGIALLSNISMLTWSVLRVTEGGLKSSIHRPNWEQAFLPLSRPERAVAKLLIDGAGVHTAQGLAAAAMLVWLHFVVGDRPLVGQSPVWVTVLLLAITSVWIALTRLLGRSLARATARPEALEEARPDIPLPDS